MSAPSSPVHSFTKFTLTVSVPEPVAPPHAAPAIVFVAEGPTAAISPIGSPNGAAAAPAVPQIARHQLSVPSTAESSPALAAAAAGVKQTRRFFKAQVALGGPVAGALENALQTFKVTPLPSPYTMPFIDLDGEASPVAQPQALAQGSQPNSPAVGAPPVSDDGYDVLTATDSEDAAPRTASPAPQIQPPTPQLTPRQGAGAAVAPAQVQYALEEIDAGDEADDEHSTTVSAAVSPARAVHAEPVAQQS